MKPTNAILNSILASRQFITADLYQFTLADGDQLFYAGGGAQADINYNGRTFSAGNGNILNPAIAATPIGTPQSINNTSTGQVTLTTTAPITAGSLIFLFVIDSTRPNIAISNASVFDTALNGYQLIFVQPIGADIAGDPIAIFTCVNTNVMPVGTKITFQALPNVSGAVQILGYVVTGYSNGIYDIIASTSVNATGSTTSVTSRNPGQTEIQIGVACTASNVTFTGPAGFSNFQQVSDSSGSPKTICGGTIVSSGPTTFNPTGAGSARNIAVIICFKQNLAQGGYPGPYFDRKDNKAKVAWRLGTGNDQLVIDVVPGNATINSLGFLDAVRCGLFDAADFQLYRAFIASPQVVPPTINGVYPLVWFDTVANYWWYNQFSYSDAGAWLIAMGTTFTRASTAYYTNSAGVLAQAPINFGRFDYDPVSLTLKGLLVEDTATNLQLHSQDFAATWGHNGNGTIADNQSIAPDGTLTAGRYTEGTTNNTWDIYQTFFTAIANTVYTGSGWIRAGGGGRYVGIGLVESGYTNGFWANIDATDGAVVGQGAFGNGVVNNVQVVPYANGWFRVIITGIVNSAAGNPVYFDFGASQSSGTFDQNYVGNGTRYFDMWGAQIEKQNFGTSYIPTTTATATRSPDLFAPIFLPPAISFTMFGYADVLGHEIFPNNQMVATFTSNGTNNRDNLFVNFGAQIVLETIVANTHIGDVSEADIEVVPFRVAGSWGPSGTALSQNGDIHTTTFNASPILNNTLNIANLGINNAQFNGHLRQIGYWPVTASNAALQALTSTPVVYTTAHAPGGLVQPGCAVLMFQGRVAEVDADRALATFTINDYRELLSQQLPRNLFAASCANTFGDQSCTVHLAQFSEIGSVLSNTTQNTIFATLSNATSYYDMGKITFTSGQLLGLAFGVSKWTQGIPGTIQTYQAMPHVPAIGDTFVISPGCDKTFAGGCTKYNNTQNFRGEPYVPAPETAL